MRLIIGFLDEYLACSGPHSPCAWCRKEEQGRVGGREGVGARGEQVVGLIFDKETDTWGIIE